MVRTSVLIRTNNGFEIAETDLQLRGPGDLMGTQQSGILDLMIADLAQDGKLLQQARDAAVAILESDPELKKPQNLVIKKQVESVKKATVNWSRIS